MIPLAIFSTWISLTVPHLTDAQGHHFLARQLPTEARDAFAVACIESNPFPGDDGRACGSFLVVMAGLESGFSLHIRGDGGAALGPWQEHFGGSARDESWIVSTRHYLRTVAMALRACPTQPIAMLAGQRCGASTVNAQRWAQVERLAALPLTVTQ